MLKLLKSRTLNKWLAYTVIATLLASIIFVWAAYAIESRVQITLDQDINTTDGSHSSTTQRVVAYGNKIYVFYRESDGTCAYRKSTDYGASFADPVAVQNALDCIQIEVWADGELEGQTGSTIHITTLREGGGVNECIYYRSLDTSTDTLGTSVCATNLAFQTTGTFDVGANTISITKSADNVVYIGVIDSADSYVLKCPSSCTSPTTWSEAGTNPFDNNDEDQLILMPLDDGSNDIMAIRWDADTDDIQSKVYDASGGTWAAGWTTIDANAQDYNKNGFGAAITKSGAPNTIYLTYHDNDSGPGTNDIKVKSVNTGTPTTWVTETNVLTNDSRQITVVKSGTRTSQVDVGYAAHTSGDINTGFVYVKTSTDGGSTWGTEEKISKTAENITGISGIRNQSISAGSANSWYIIWMGANNDDLYGASKFEITVGVFEVESGGLAIKAPASNENFGSGAVNPIGAGSTQVDHVFTQIVEYADLRGGEPITPFNISVTATAFEGQGGAAGSSFTYSGNFLIHASGQFPSLTDIYGDCSASTTVLGTLTAFSGTLTESDPITLVNAASTSASGTAVRQCSFTPVVRVLIPEAQKTGTYRTTLSFTII